MGAAEWSMIGAIFVMIFVHQGLPKGDWIRRVCESKTDEETAPGREWDMEATAD